MATEAVVAVANRMRGAMSVLLRRPPGLPPVPRRPVPALIIAMLIAIVLWWSVPAGLRVMAMSGWHPETVLTVLGAHAAFLLSFGWFVWLFWAGRRPGDGG